MKSGSDAKLYYRAAIAGLTTYFVVLAGVFLVLHPATTSQLLGVLFFPTGPAVILATAANLNSLKPPMRRYFWRFTAGMIAYVLGIAIANRLYSPQSPYKYWLILLPVIPISYLVTAIVRGVADMDEMKRKIVTEAAAFSCLATGFTCFSYLFFRDMGAPEFRSQWAFYLMWLYYMIGLFFSYRRYR